MPLTVDVRRAASVVTREDAIELKNTISVTELYTTEHRVVKVGFVVRVAVSSSVDTTIDTLRLR